MFFQNYNDFMIKKKQFIIIIKIIIKVKINKKIKNNKT